MTLGEIIVLIIFISLIPAIIVAIIFFVNIKDSEKFKYSFLPESLMLFIMFAVVFESFVILKYLSLIYWNRQIF